MTTAKNNITGDSLVSKPNTDAYRNNWDRIFGKNKTEPVVIPDEEFIKDKCPECGIDMRQISSYSCQRARCPVFTQATC